MERINRENYLSILKNFKDQQIIKVITGIRRCGKSTLLEIFQDYLKENGVEAKQIISINFENADYEELQDRKKLYEYIKERLVKGKKTYVFLDEIQNVNEFEKTVDSLFINKDVDLYITGSNAWLLSSELATYIAGRYIEIKIYTLSFKEYLEFKGLNKNDCDIKKELKEFIRMGGFPAINIGNYEYDEAYELIKDIYSSAILRDTVQRYNIRNVELLERVVKFVFDNIGNK